MKHLLKIIVALAILLIFYTVLNKNKIVEGHGGGGWGHGGGGFGGGRGWGYGGGRGYGRGWGYGGGRGYGRGWGYGGGRGYGRGWGYNTLYYPQNLCYDSLGNLTYCFTPSYFY